MSELEALRELIREEIANFGPSLLPGGRNALPGLDPNYKTHPLYQAHSLTTDGAHTDGESEFAINAGETKQFKFVLNNAVTNGVYGVSIMTPPGIGAKSSAVIMQVINGKTRARALSSSNDFNGPVGRFNTGTLIIEGVIENGPQPGLVKVAYGAPETEADLELTAGNQSGAIVTGDATITLPKAGTYVVTWVVEEALP